MKLSHYHPLEQDLHSFFFHLCFVKVIISHDYPSPRSETFLGVQSKPLFFEKPAFLFKQVLATLPLGNNPFFPTPNFLAGTPTCPKITGQVLPFSCCPSPLLLPGLISAIFCPPLPLFKHWYNKKRELRGAFSPSPPPSNLAHASQFLGPPIQNSDLLTLIICFAYSFQFPPDFFFSARLRHISRCNDVWLHIWLPPAPKISLILRQRFCPSIRRTPLVTFQFSPLNTIWCCTLFLSLTTFVFPPPFIRSFVGYLNPLVAIGPFSLPPQPFFVITSSPSPGRSHTPQWCGLSFFGSRCLFCSLPQGLLLPFKGPPLAGGVCFWWAPDVLPRNFCSQPFFLPYLASKTPSPSPFFFLDSLYIRLFFFSNCGAEAVKGSGIPRVSFPLWECFVPVVLSPQHAFCLSPSFTALQWVPPLPPVPNFLLS